MARCALVILDPEGTWKEHLQVLKKEDIQGLGKDLDKTNGCFVPSWIWLVPWANVSATQNEEEFNDSMRAECVKTWARTMNDEVAGGASDCRGGNEMSSDMV
jgi:hypothetical protein